MRRTADLGYFGDEECNAFREAIKKRIQEAASFSGLTLEPSADINDCNTPDDANFYLSFTLSVPGTDEELYVEASVTNNPYMTLQFHLMVGDEEESYEVELENANQEAMMEVISDAFAKGWADRTGSEVVWEALKPFFPADAVPEARFSSTTADMVKYPHEYEYGQDELDEGEVVFPLQQKTETIHESPMIPQESLVKDYLYMLAIDRWHPDVDHRKLWLHGVLDDIYLASLAAKKFELPNLLKDPDHPVWEWIEDVAEKAEDQMSLSGSKRRHSGSYSTEMSAPMFSTTGEGELEFTISDEIAEDPEMMGLVDVAYDMASQGGQINWAEMAEYIQAIYDKYGTSPDLAAPANWDLVARSVHERIMKTPIQKMGLATESPFPPPHHRMQREEGGYKSKKKLKEWLEAEGAPYKGWSDETFGRQSMIFLQWPDVETKREWNQRMKDAGFAVDFKYGARDLRNQLPESPRSAVQVSYFKGWHWDE